MLEQMRRNSRSFIIWILFGIIIAVFIISFGPQAGPDSLACGQATNDSAMEVDGEDVSLSSWRFAVNALRGGGQSSIRRQQAVDSLVERELLAQAAEAQGFRVDDDAVNHAMAAGEFLILGQRIRQDDPAFLSDYKQLENFAGQLGLTNVRQLIDEQRREQTAEMMRQLILRSATVSDEEARQVYINQNTRITADYVKFDTRRYRSALNQLGQADLDRYIADHDDELKKAWEAEKAQWATDKPRVLARILFIAKDTGKPGARPPARKRAEDAHARLAGGADFATVASEQSEDRPSRTRGGLLGWRPADSLGQGKEVVEAVKKLEVGKLSDVIEGERGFYIARVEERSDKGLTYEQKRLDLAVRAAPEFYAKELARRDAQQALALAATQPLDKQFERKSPAAGGMNDLGGIGNELPQDLPPEVLEQLEQLKNQGIDVKTVPPDGITTPGEPGDEGSAPADGAGEAPADEAAGKQGTLWIREGASVLAQSGGAPAAPPSGSTPAEPAGSTPAKPAGSTPAKPAGSTPAKPAGSTPAKPAGSTPAKPVAPAAGSPTVGADGLPAVTVAKPTLDTVGPVARMGDFLPGVGKSEKAVTDLFEKLEVGKLAPEVYELPDGYAVILLKEREEADVTKFAESRPELLEQLAYQKGAQRLSQWVTQRCEATAKSGEIKVNRELFAEGSKAEEEAGYQPCATLGARFGGRRPF